MQGYLKKPPPRCVKHFLIFPIFPLYWDYNFTLIFDYQKKSIYFSLKTRIQNSAFKNPANLQYFPAFSAFFWTNLNNLSFNEQVLISHFNVFWQSQKKYIRKRRVYFIEFINHIVFLKCKNLKFFTDFWSFFAMKTHFKAKKHIKKLLR